MMYYYRPYYNANAVRIETDAQSAWVLDGVRKVDGDASVMLPEDPAVPCIRMQIGSDAEGVYTVDMEGHKSIATRHPLLTALALIKKDALMQEDYFGLHAATIRQGGRVFTFMASTGTGKTSLAAFLCSQGCQLYGDDLTLIHRRSLEVQPAYKAIMLRKPSLELLKQYDIQLETVTEHVADRIEGGYDRYCYEGFEGSHEAQPIDAFFVIHVDPQHRIRKVNDERERMKFLMMNAMRHEKFSMPYLAFMQALSRVPMYEVWYTDFHWLLRQLKNPDSFI